MTCPWETPSCCEQQQGGGYLFRKNPQAAWGGGSQETARPHHTPTGPRGKVWDVLWGEGLLHCPWKAILLLPCLPEHSAPRAISQSGGPQDLEKGSSGGGGSLMQGGCLWGGSTRAAITREASGFSGTQPVGSVGGTPGHCHQCSRAWYPLTQPPTCTLSPRVAADLDTHSLPSRMRDASSRPKREYKPKPRELLDLGEPEQPNGGFPCAAAPKTTGEGEEASSLPQAPSGVAPSHRASPL